MKTSLALLTVFLMAGTVFLLCSGFVFAACSTGLLCIILYRGAKKSE